MTTATANAADPNFDNLTIAELKVMFDKADDADFATAEAVMADILWKLRAAYDNRDDTVVSEVMSLAIQVIRRPADADDLLERLWFIVDEVLDEWELRDEDRTCLEKVLDALPMPTDMVEG
jgi:hypothetical protein